MQSQRQRQRSGLRNSQHTTAGSDGGVVELHPDRHSAPAETDRPQGNQNHYEPAIPRLGLIASFGIATSFSTVVVVIVYIAKALMGVFE